MANSSEVSAGDDILASQYNNLRADVLNTSTGHTHNGTDSKFLREYNRGDAVIAAMDHQIIKYPAPVNYEKIVEFVMACPDDYTLQVGWQIIEQKTSPSTLSLLIRKNGVDLMTAQTINDDDGEHIYKNHFGGFVKGDLLQIWLACTDAHNIVAINYAYLAADYSILPALHLI